jgi:hypothetical protein
MGTGEILHMEKLCFEYINAVEVSPAKRIEYAQCTEDDSLVHQRRAP